MSKSPSAIGRLVPWMATLLRASLRPGTARPSNSPATMTAPVHTGKNLSTRESRETTGLSWTTGCARRTGRGAATGRPPTTASLSMPASVASVASALVLVPLLVRVVPVPLVVLVTAPPRLQRSSARHGQWQPPRPAGARRQPPVQPTGRRSRLGPSGSRPNGPGGWPSRASPPGGPSGGKKAGSRRRAAPRVCRTRNARLGTAHPRSPGATGLPTPPKALLPRRAPHQPGQLQPILLQAYLNLAYRHGTAAAAAGQDMLGPSRVTDVPWRALMTAWQ